MRMSVRQPIPAHLDEARRPGETTSCEIGPKVLATMEVNNTSTATANNSL